MKNLALALLLVLLSVTFSAKADGLPLVDGRYPEGKVSVFKLTAQQKQLIEYFRTLHNNSKTPYVFELTNKQAVQLKKEAGLSPARFEVYETYLGYNDAGPHWNLALRFNEDEIEIPHKLLLSNKEARNYEFKVMGWQPNPSFKRDAALTRTAP